MTRWQPNTRERLVRAALELFLDRGYERTTVTEIAERAGLTRRTFFRYFPDKREVLFVGQDAIAGLMAEGISRAPASATPLDAVAAGLDRVAVAFTRGRRDLGPQRRAVIAANTELQERDALKRTALATSIEAALRERAVAAPAARLAAELGVLAFGAASEGWADSTNGQDFAELARRALAELRTAAASLA